MKTYVITLSRVFPVSHRKAGTPTGFAGKLGKTKIHTIRANYELWKARFAEIEKGNACLSIRQWLDKPYVSKQVEVARLTKQDGIGIQMLTFPPYGADIEARQATIDGKPYPREVIAENDGLTLEDWREWFKNYNFDKPLAVIHFGAFRY